ncbi:MAG: spore maturation protein [Oscillospiraceae bacterium]
MSNFSLADAVIPATIGLIVVYGMIKGVNVFETFIEGARDGLKIVYRIAPTMLGIMLAVSMFKSSGAMDLLSDALAPVVGIAKIPREVVPLMLMRPVSGTGALAIFKDIISQNGPDSYAGRVASVMQGSTETMFYTIALYYGVTKVKKTRHTLGAAAVGDIAGFIMSALAVTLLMS